MKLKKQFADLSLLFISAVSGQGLQELKDIIWEQLNTDGYKKVIEISHAPIDVKVIERQEEPEEEQVQTIYLNEEDDWDLSKYKGIGWDE